MFNGEGQSVIPGIEMDKAPKMLHIQLMNRLKKI